MPVTGRGAPARPLGAGPTRATGLCQLRLRHSGRVRSGRARRSTRTPSKPSLVGEDRQPATRMGRCQCTRCPETNGEVRVSTHTGRRPPTTGAARSAHSAVLPEATRDLQPVRPNTNRALDLDPDRARAVAAVDAGGPAGVVSRCTPAMLTPVPLAFGPGPDRASGQDRVPAR
jgi:hypothetical protein